MFLSYCLVWGVQHWSLKTVGWSQVLAWWWILTQDSFGYSGHNWGVCVKCLWCQRPAKSCNKLLSCLILLIHNILCMCKLSLGRWPLSISHSYVGDFRKQRGGREGQRFQKSVLRSGPRFILRWQHPEGRQWKGLGIFMKGQKLSPKGKQLRSAIILQVLRNLQVSFLWCRLMLTPRPLPNYGEHPPNVSEKTEKGRDERRRSGGRELQSPLFWKDSLPG